MPEISRFYGIVIRMYWADHLPPHFHAHYGSNQAQIRIDPVGLFRGRFAANCGHGGRVGGIAPQRVAS